MSQDACRPLGTGFAGACILRPDTGSACRPEASPTTTVPGAPAPRRPEPVGIDNHDGYDLGDDELSEHALIVQADGSFSWAPHDDDPACGYRRMTS
jgi:hypothetical protein